MCQEDMWPVAVLALQAIAIGANGRENAKAPGDESEPVLHSGDRHPVVVPPDENLRYAIIDMSDPDPHLDEIGGIVIGLGSQIVSATETGIENGIGLLVTGKEIESWRGAMRGLFSLISSPLFRLT